MTARLYEIRKQLGWTQRQLATNLGLSYRTVQDAEADPARERAVNVLAAEYIALRMAVAEGDAALASEETRELARRLDALKPPKASPAG